jgi:hypothetical protein
LNNSLLLTQGNPISFSALSSRLNVGFESYSAICPASDGNSPLVGQVQHYTGERSAHLAFLAPEPPSTHPGLLGLLDFLAIQSGEMCATNLLAEVKDSDPILETLRVSGFGIYGWETIWKLPEERSVTLEKSHNHWNPMTAADETAVRTLYQTLVPPLVQASEPYTGADLSRLVFQNSSGEITAYVESITGPKGIYLKPVIHPGVEKADELLEGLLYIFQGLGKPVYLQMRSYQAWLTSPLEALGALTTIHFALMVRHLAVSQFAPANHRQLSIDHRRAETSAQIIQKMSDSQK